MDPYTYQSRRRRGKVTARRRSVVDRLAIFTWSATSAVYRVVAHEVKFVSLMAKKAFTRDKKSTSQTSRAIHHPASPPQRPQESEIQHVSREQFELKKRQAEARELQEQQQELEKKIQAEASRREALERQLQEQKLLHKQKEDLLVQQKIEQEKIAILEEKLRYEAEQAQLAELMTAETKKHTHLERTRSIDQNLQADSHYLDLKQATEQSRRELEDKAREYQILRESNRRDYVAEFGALSALGYQKVVRVAQSLGLQIQKTAYVGTLGLLTQAQALTKKRQKKEQPTLVVEKPAVAQIVENPVENEDFVIRSEIEYTTSSDDQSQKSTSLVDILFRRYDFIYLSTAWWKKTLLSTHRIPYDSGTAVQLSSIGRIPHWVWTKGALLVGACASTVTALRLSKKTHVETETHASDYSKDNFIMAHIKKAHHATKPRRKGGVYFWLHRLAFFSLICFFLLLGIFFIWVATLDIPRQNIDERIVAQSTKIYDNTGKVLLYDVFKDERRTSVSLDKISENMKLAILAIEDDQFYEHNGVRPTALLRAIYFKLRDPSSRLQGGSTITQQTIKNALLNSDRKIERKVKEWVLAWRLEKEKTKDEILEIYLNEIAFGGPVYGVEQASQSFFGVSAAELSIAQATYLAAIPKAPTFYINNPAKLEARAGDVLNRMIDLGYITPAQYKEASSEAVEFVERVDKGIKAPHFVFYVQEQVEEALTDVEIDTDGMRIKTTLDWELQQKLEAIVPKHIDRIKQFNAENLSAVVIENATGKILAMVGSRDYFDEEIDGKFNVATAQRQPGSTFKPFVYANAFRKGYTPETVVWDTQTEFSSSCYPDGEPRLPQYADSCYRPGNYDNRFRGPISFRSALAQSLNIPAVKALYLAGIADSLVFAKQLGLTGLNKSPSFYGLNLVLGGGEVRLIDMVSAYSVFATGGVRNPSAVIEEIVNRNGKDIARYENNAQRVVDTQTAAMVNSVLSDDDAKRPMFGANSVLYFNNRSVAVKTGTTNNFRDAWTIGYDPSVTVGVWAGNNDNTSMNSQPSSVVVGAFWREAMSIALEQFPAKQFASYEVEESTLKPIMRGIWEGDKILYESTETGDIIDNATEEEIEAGLYTQIVAPNYHSILHWVDKNNPTGVSPAFPGSDPLYENWEFSVAEWAEAAGLKTELDIASSSELVDNEDDDDDDDTRDRDERDEPLNFSIESPTSGALVNSDEQVTISIDIEGNSRDIENIYYYLNSTYLGAGTARTTTMKLVPAKVRGVQNENTIKVIVETDSGRRIERESLLRVN